MKDEFEFLERLFFDTYGHCFLVSNGGVRIDYIDKKIGEDIISEFDKIKRSYFDIAGRVGSEEEVQFMFVFRAKRLLNFKTKIENYLKDAVNELVLSSESYSLVHYNNLLFAYEGVVDLLKFIIERLFISLEGTINEESLVMKYNWIDADQVNEWQEEFNKNYSLGDDFVLVDGITIDARIYSKDLMYPKNLENKKRILQMVNGDFIEDSDTFGRLIMDVKNRIDLTSKDSKEQKILYQGLAESLNAILKKKDKFEREQEALNLLIETNVAPQETIDFSIEHLNRALFGKNEKGRNEILIAFRRRLYKLKDSPSYRDYHLSNITTSVDVTLDKLIVFVERKLENYNSSLLSDSTSINSLGKIKTTLTVPQISLLFRMLSDEGFIESKNVSKLARQIALSFSSTGKDDFKDDTIRNGFYSPITKAIDSWRTTLVRFNQLLNDYEKK